MKKELLAKYIAKLPKDFNLPNVMLTVYFDYFREKSGSLISLSGQDRAAGIQLT